MSETIIEKILSRHAGRPVRPGDIADIVIDARIARDFGGASVVKNLKEHNLAVEDVSKTFFTFDCNPGGSDQKYAANQHLCRLFARERGVNLFDVDKFDAALPGEEPAEMLVGSVLLVGPAGVAVERKEGLGDVLDGEVVLL